MPPPWLAACRAFTFPHWPELATTITTHLILDLDTITVCLPLFVSILITLLTFKKKTKILNDEKKRVSWGVVNNVRLLLALLALVSNVIFRLLLLLDSAFCFHDIILLALAFFTFVLGIGDLLAVVLLHRVTSMTQILFWTSISACNVPHLLTAVHLNQIVTGAFILSLLVQLLAFVLLVLQWFPYTTNQSIRDSNRNEDSSSFIQNLFFHFLR